MLKPPWFKSTTHPQAVCRLKKSLYSLKQAPRAWHSKITQYLHQIGFKMSKSNNSMFIRSDSKRHLFIIIYVDGLVNGGEHIANIDHITKLLSSWFKMKDMKEIHYFLDIEVIRTPYDITISQRHYILNLLFKFGMTESKHVITPSQSKPEVRCQLWHIRVWADSLSTISRKPDLSHHYSIRPYLPDQPP